jgi:large subunit ribosomal protein L15
MKLNGLRPAEGSRTTRRRVGRGIGSGLGKTCGRGHKGDRARANHKKVIGFEGGQMPLQRRLPKFGFRSRRPGEAEVRLDTLAKVKAEVVDLAALKAAGAVPAASARAKVILAGALSGPVVVKGLAVSKGAREKILEAGGRVEE